MENSTHESKFKKPIVLGHAACSGGSLIYRLILSTFRFRGLSEIGVARIPNPNRYNPWDPQFQFFGQDVYSPQEFEDILFERILACAKKSEALDEQLLLREHTHSFFFNPLNPEIVPEGGSWIADQYKMKLQMDLKCLVSIRDPIDSWLGFRKGFPLQWPRCFNEYCRRYNDYLDRIDRQNQSKNSFYLFKYEDLIHEPQNVVDEISHFLDLTEHPVDFTAVGKKVGSGNSGRSSKELSQRARRPYSWAFIEAARTSSEYARLVERLGYPKLEDELSLTKRIKATYYSAINPFLKPAKHLRAHSKKLKSLAQGIGNIE